MSLNEEKILAGKFVFVSYSHKDGTAVKEDMSALLSRGVRVWFDENMRIGDNWVEIARKVMHHENCEGVLFYNSANAFVSSAVQEEQKTTRELGLKRWSIHLDSKSTTAISIEAMNLLVGQYGPTNQVVSQHMMQVMPVQNEMFDERILCFMRTDSASLVQRLYNEIAVPYRLVDNEENFLLDLQKNDIAQRGTDDIILGKYVSGEYLGPEKPSNMCDQRFGVSNDLIQLNRKSYTTKELRWRLMYVQDGKAVLLCNRIIRQASYYEGKAFLDKTFCSVAFTQDEMKKFGEINARYMTAYDIEQCTDKHALELGVPSKLKHWWIDADGLTENWKQTFSGDYRYANGFSCLNKKGVRPVIEISAHEII